jgi:hypothetical protein
MSARKTVHVTCHECGMCAEIRLEALGLRYCITVLPALLARADEVIE